jgi:hypothetical protein
LRPLVLSLVSLGLVLAAALAASSTASTPLSPKLRADLAAVVSGEATGDGRLAGLVPGLAPNEIPYFAVLSEPNDAAHQDQVVALGARRTTSISTRPTMTSRPAPTPSSRRA